MKIKDRLYHSLVEKNANVESDYKTYVNDHKEEHRHNRFKHWLLLVKLNWHYRVKKRSTPFFTEINDAPQASGPKPASQAVHPKAAPPKPVPNAPYMDGPEATKRGIEPAYRFACGLFKYDVISFDIFDTLILRRLHEPKAVFALVGEKLGIFNFFGIRSNAEAEVREENFVLRKSRECTLGEIYERVEYYTGIDAELGMKTELEVEYDMCCANPYMYEVFQILLSQGKTIYITSNMYLPKQVMIGLLEKCGYYGMADVLVSCDYHCSKTNGALFKILRSKLPPKASVVHIGDNMATDIIPAKAEKIDTRYYAACRDLGTPHRTRGISPLIASAYFATVNNRLHCGVHDEKELSIFWEHGFVYGGLWALGYANYIHENALKKGITKVLFLARDGYVFYKVFKMLFCDVEAEYIYWSRLSAIRNTAEDERNVMLTRLFGETCNSGASVADCLRLAGLEGMTELFKKNGFDPSLPLLKENKKIVWDILLDNREIVQKELAPIKSATKKYLSTAVGDHKNIAIADLGWSGKNDLPLKRIIEGLGSNIKCCIFLCGSIFKWENTSSILSGNLNCYIFDAAQNRDIHDAFCKQNSKRAISLELVEKVFSAAHNSFIGFDKNGNMEFASPEIENYKLYSETENGIMDFCLEYISAFHKYPFMFNISGYDAFLPIRLIFNNRVYQKKLLSGAVYNSGLIPDNRCSLNGVL